MKEVFLKLSITLLFLCNFKFNAQNITAACDGEKYHQFDFWIGNWNVYDATDKLIGTNLIQKHQNNCVLQENWVSKTSSNTGTSYNFYNKNTDTWQQIWIDNTGFSLELKGKFEDDKMILKSELQTTTNGAFYNQITWFKNNNGNVIQIWELIDENGKTIKEVFRGVYKRILN